MKTILVPTEHNTSMVSALDTALLLAQKFGSFIEGFSLRPAVADLVAMDPDSGLTMVAVAQNPIDAVWPDRPAPPIDPATPYPVAQAGESGSSLPGFHAVPAMSRCAQGTPSLTKRLMNCAPTIEPATGLPAMFFMSALGLSISLS